MQSDGHPGHAINSSNTTQTRTKLLLRQEYPGIGVSDGSVNWTNSEQVWKTCAITGKREINSWAGGELSCCHSGHHRALMD